MYGSGHNGITVNTFANSSATTAIGKCATARTCYQTSRLSREGVRGDISPSIGGSYIAAIGNKPLKQEAQDSIQTTTTLPKDPQDHVMLEQPSVRQTVHPHRSVASFVISYHLGTTFRRVHSRY